jgi:hypothetical protein
MTPPQGHSFSGREAHRDLLESDTEHGLPSARATSAYVLANPSKYGKTSAGMCSRSTLCSQLSQLNGLVYAQKQTTTFEVKAAPPAPANPSDLSEWRLSQSDLATHLTDAW